MQKTVDKQYVSGIDKYLNELRKQLPSAAQKKEYEQYQRINELRDDPNAKKAEDPFE